MGSEVWKRGVKTETLFEEEEDHRKGTKCSPVDSGPTVRSGKHQATRGSYESSRPCVRDWDW